MTNNPVRRFGLNARELRILRRAAAVSNVSLAAWGARRVERFAHDGHTEAKPERTVFNWQVIAAQAVFDEAERKAADRDVTLREVLRHELDDWAWGTAQATANLGLQTPSCPKCLDDMFEAHDIWLCRDCNVVIWPEREEE